MSRTDLVVVNHPVAAIKKNQLSNVIYLIAAALAIGGLSVLWIFLGHSAAGKLWQVNHFAKAPSETSASTLVSTIDSTPHRASSGANKITINDTALRDNAATSEAVDLPSFEELQPWVAEFNRQSAASTRPGKHQIPHAALTPSAKK